MVTRLRRLKDEARVAMIENKHTPSKLFLPYNKGKAVNTCQECGDKAVMDDGLVYGEALERKCFKTRCLSEPVKEPRMPTKEELDIAHNFNRKFNGGK
jgi:hypothetical protein